MVPTIVVIIWIVGSVIVGLFSTSRRFGFWGGFFFSLLLSPIIMIIILMMTQTKRDRIQKT